jgi:Cft2 family RNA processing exonuclease
MYRIGHGDCFLLAFEGKTEDRPVYVLIDCGYKPGSPGFINTKAADIARNIRAATGGHIDIAVITHEHQDHVNGITQSHLKDTTIGETWFAWTEKRQRRSRQ